MMLLKLVPNVSVDLPLTAYYGITFMSLNVGTSGINACSIRVGIENFDFKPAPGADDKSVLYVNGDTGYNPTHRLFEEHEKIMLVIDQEAAINEAVVLEYYLTYSVPTSHNEVSQS